MGSKLDYFNYSIIRNFSLNLYSFCDYLQKIDYNNRNRITLVYKAIRISAYNKKQATGKMNVNREETIKNSVHHMVMACLSGDTEYLEDEINALMTKFNPMDTTATAEETEMLKSVSLEASLNNRVNCLDVLYRMSIPMDELCPIIAACHGKKDVVVFCEKISLGDCSTAWNRYFDWMMCHSSQSKEDDECENLVFASDWITSYKCYTASNQEQMGDEIMCSAN